MQDAALRQQAAKLGVLPHVLTSVPPRGPKALWDWHDFSGVGTYDLVTNGIAAVGALLALWTWAGFSAVGWMPLGFVMLSCLVSYFPRTKLGEAHPWVARALLLAFPLVHASVTLLVLGTAPTAWAHLFELPIDLHTLTLSTLLHAPLFSLAGALYVLGQTIQSLLFWFSLAMAARESRGGEERRAAQKISVGAKQLQQARRYRQARCRTGPRNQQATR